MAGKLDKLNELGELIKSGAISQDEFNNLKKEILESADKSEYESKPVKQKENKTEKANQDKVQLKSFRDINNKQIKAPDIQFLNFKNITKDEIKLLKPFLRLKQIHSPEEMTNDEIDIGNKLFTIAEINQMNSVRSGFNYPWGTILGFLAVIISAVLLYISPCFGLLGAGTGLVYGTFSCGYVFTRSDATSLDKKLSGSAVILAIMVFLFMDTIHNWQSNSSSSNTIDCIDKTGAYEQGFASGKTARMLSDYSSCSSYVDDYNYQTGRNILSASDCFCEGYNDGKNGENSKY